MGSLSSPSDYWARSLFEDRCNVQGGVVEREVENLTLVLSTRIYG